MRQWVSLAISIGICLCISGVIFPVTYASSVVAPYDSTVTITYHGNPYLYNGEMIDFEPVANLSAGEPYNQYLATVGSETYVGPNFADMGASYHLGEVQEGQEVIVNITDDLRYYSYNRKYSSNSTLSNAVPVITSVETMRYTRYDVAWQGVMYEWTRPGEIYYADHGELYDHPLSITFTKPWFDSLSNLTEVREFYTDVYPHHWDSPSLKVPCVVVMDSDNKVTRVLVKSSWDPATIGLTKGDVESWVYNTYGVMPTYV